MSLLNISVYAMDLRGHGISGGERRTTDDFEDYVRDLKTFVDLVAMKTARSCWAIASVEA